MMKKMVLILAVCLLLTLSVGCNQADPAETTASTAGTTEATVEASTADTTEETTEAPTKVSTVPQPESLAGSWQRTHTEVEGDRNPNTSATLTITGNTESGLFVTYQDTEFPDDNFKDKALTIKEGALYPDCGNNSWYAEVDSSGKYSYYLTLLEDGTLLLQCHFDFDGQPMVSTQWFIAC